MAREIVIIENFTPDHKAMQDALEWVLRKGGSKREGTDRDNGRDISHK